jgi:hypothetical protein
MTAITEKLHRAFLRPLGDAVLRHSPAGDNNAVLRRRGYGSMETVSGDGSDVTGHAVVAVDQVARAALVSHGYGSLRDACERALGVSEASTETEQTRAQRFAAAEPIERALDARAGDLVGSRRVNGAALQPEHFN